MDMLYIEKGQWFLYTSNICVLPGNVTLNLLWGDKGDI